MWLCAYHEVSGSTADAYPSAIESLASLRPNHIARRVLPSVGRSWDASALHRPSTSQASLSEFHYALCGATPIAPHSWPAGCAHPMTHDSQ